MEVTNPYENLPVSNEDFPELKEKTFEKPILVRNSAEKKHVKKGKKKRVSKKLEYYDQEREILGKTVHSGRDASAKDPFSKDFVRETDGEDDLDSHVNAARNSRIFWKNTDEFLDREGNFSASTGCSSGSASNFLRAFLPRPVPQYKI